MKNNILKNFSFQKFFFSFGLPFLTALVGTLLGNPIQSVKDIIKPSFFPPSIIFPIVWTLLYFLMGVSYYLIINTKENSLKKARFYFLLQLIFNGTWTYLFFSLKLYFVSFLWIILLIVFVICMIKEFYHIKKITGLLQIPYLLWLLFAAFLNFVIYLIN